MNRKIRYNFHKVSMQLFNLVIIGIGRAGVELAMIISVERDVENTGVTVEHLLGSIPIV